MIRNWDTRKLKDEILNNLEEKGELAGVFVQLDAKRRLLKINNPRWGLGYRASLAFKRLKYEVERKSNEVEIRVGIVASAKSRHHGFYLEVGSHTHGPQPFLRPAVFENANQIVRIMQG